MSIEVESLLLPSGRIVHNAKLELESKGSYWFKTAVHPGFSDAHAHPHVVDVGSLDSHTWNNVVEWIRGRELKIDEKALRKDVELCTQLSKLTMLKAILNGTTMIALVGNLKANYRACRELNVRPRVIVMPTIFNSEGWYTSGHILPQVINILKDLRDDSIKIGVFCHSLYFTEKEDILLSIEISRSLNLPLALHLNEGTRDLNDLRKLIKGNDCTIIGVHCIEDEDYRSLGIKVVSCPISNLFLYGRTQENLDLIDAFGTDWPNIVGSLREHVPKIISIFKLWNRVEVFKRLTSGGYKIYAHSYEGDYVFFDEDIERVLSEPSEPVYVTVGGKFVVMEHTTMGYTLDEINKMIHSVKRHIIELYPNEQYRYRKCELTT